MNDNDLVFFGEKEIKFRKLGSIDLKTLTDKAPYLAGLLDGEGCFVLREVGKTYPRFTPIIELAMTHEDTVKWSAQVCNVTKAKAVRDKPHKDVHYTRIYKQDDVRLVCKAILPYMITKRKQVKLFLEYFSLKQKLIYPVNRNISINKPIIDEMISVFIEIKKANERGKTPDYDAMRRRLLERISETQEKRLF